MQTHRFILYTGSLQVATEGQIGRFWGLVLPQNGIARKNTSWKDDNTSHIEHRILGVIVREDEPERLEVHVCENDG